jgi:chemotaxis protein methyltransferase CheR
MTPMERPPFDCVFIRNVLIYFDPASKQAVVGRLLESLELGGYLVVGPSEGVHDLLKSLKKYSSFLYQKS